MEGRGVAIDAHAGVRHPLVAWTEHRHHEPLAATPESGPATAGPPRAGSRGRHRPKGLASTRAIRRTDPLSGGWTRECSEDRGQTSRQTAAAQPSTAPRTRSGGYGPRAARARRSPVARSCSNSSLDFSGGRRYTAGVFGAARGALSIEVPDLTVRRLRSSASTSETRPSVARPKPCNRPCRMRERRPVIRV